MLDARGKLHGRRRHVTYSMAALAALLLVISTIAVASYSASTGGVCAQAERTITYNVSAFQTLIPLNGWGDHIPDGLTFALTNDDASPNKAQIQENPNLTQPLVLRANVGDCIKVKFKNDIAGKRVGVHVSGLNVDPKDSDGARVGYNPDTTVASGGTTTYTWYAGREGEFLINDYGSGTVFKLGDKTGTTAKGLYGGIIVHPKGSSWHDPITGRDLLDDQNVGVGAQPFADIHAPGENNDYRDIAYVFWDEPEGVLDKNGKAPTFPLTGLKDSSFGINYRSEPLRNRMRAVLEHRGEVFDAVSGKLVDTGPKNITLPNGTVIKPEDHFCDGYVPELDKIVEDPAAKCAGEEAHLQSWIFGDNGKLTRKLGDGTIMVDNDLNIPKSYKGDPIRFRMLHPGVKETHTWHQHTMRWRHEDNDPTSTRLDVQSVSPGQTFLFNMEGGAGSVTGTVGDQIHHCHLYPHFAEGFWGQLRVYDRLRRAEYEQQYPDGTPLEELKELPDRAGNTPSPDEDHPGYPLFVKGDFGQKAYRPPGHVVNDPFDKDGFRRPGDAVREGDPVERPNMKLDENGKPIPGVFYVDPCPAGVPQRNYYPAVIDASIVYNEAGWKDPNGKIYVEAPPGDGKSALQKANEVRQQINAGTKQAEPYTMRSRVGECVNLRTTNAGYLDDDPSVPMDIHAPEGDTFHDPTPITEAGNHVHLVRFDELGSDGTSVGWNYSQNALNGQTVGYRWFIDVPLRTIFSHDHQNPNTQQQHGLWAAMNVEPVGATWHDPKTGEQTNGVGTVADIHVPPTGQSTADPADFREFTVHYSDFIPQVDAAGKPLNPPKQPGSYADDQGVMAINFRNAPFPTRIDSTSTGKKAEPANIFSSVVHGDPSTPIFRAYAGDPTVFRFMDGAHEEQHNFNLSGHRWLHQPDNPNSNLYSTQAASLAEFFNFEVDGAQVIKRSTGREKMREAAELEYGATLVLPSGAGAPADYLYSSQPLNDLWVGMWGIFRVPAARVSNLKTLPGGPQPPLASKGSEWPALKPGGTLNSAPLTDPGNPCPAGAPSRTFKISIVKQKLTYNKFGDNDPSGVIYVLDQDLNTTGASKAGTGSKPLFIRANEGDCVTLKLTNRLPSAGIPVHSGDPVNPLENIGLTNLVDGRQVTVQATWPAGNRASLHMSGLTRYAATRSDGSAVGYNFDSSVAPGKIATYRIYLDTKTIGIANFSNWANIRGTRHHGAWGGLIVEPRKSVFLNPKDFTARTSGADAVIKYPVTSSKSTVTYKYFREYVIDLQDGLNLFDKNGLQIADEAAAEPDGEAEAEDSGEKGINYRSERFANRLAINPELAWVMSSTIHGDPATPVLRAYLGDPVMIRALNSQDLPRTHTFGIVGHEWSHELYDPNSNVLNAQGGFNTGRAFNFDLGGVYGGKGGGAGGPAAVAGDFLYNDRNFYHGLSGGIWGMLRVHDTTKSDLKRLP